ncbi:hypothetical protein F5Y14DRAFT_130213 [Nemania sp. NC0429]|nr:hypothetical protein F5Y14DRAFT_130213 [Nemania sp. NC0429]
MAPLAFRTAFVGLSAIGLSLLWGTMALNGTLFKLLEVSGSGIYPDGRVMELSYTRLPLVDRLICILVAFFDVLSNLVDVAPYLMLLDLVGTIMVINLMTLVENRRSPRLGLSPTLWQYSWNCGGVAVFLPLYARNYVQEKPKKTYPLPRSEAQAIPFTTLWSVILALPLFVPALVTASPVRIQQGVVAFFFAIPAFSAFQAVARRAIAKTGYVGSTKPIQLAYLIAGGLSALVHVGVIFYIARSSTDGLSLSRVFVPHPGRVQLGQPHVLTETSLLFIQYDYLVIYAVVALLAFYAAYYGPTRKEVGGLTGLLAATVITVTLGAGAGLAFVLCGLEGREDLPKRAVSKT